MMNNASNQQVSLAPKSSLGNEGLACVHAHANGFIGILNAEVIHCFRTINNRT